MPSAQPLIDPFPASPPLQVVEPGSPLRTGVTREPDPVAFPRRPELSFVVPAHNEEANVAPLVKALVAECQALGVTLEIVLVDDGSRDGTATAVTALVPEFPVRLLRLSRNFGKEHALTAGIEHAAGRAVILMDADLQHPVALIGEFIRLWREGYEMVYGLRAHRRDESRFKQTASRGFYRLLGSLTAVPIPPDAGDFRLLDRKAVDALRALPERNRFMKGLYHWVGFRQIAVPYEVAERHSGRSSFNARRLFALAVTGLTSFSQVPLRLASAAGAAVSLCSILYALFIVARTLLIGRDVPGWATLTTGVLFLGGIQLLFIGVLGEYVGRIFDEVKRRPNYIIAEDSGPVPPLAS